MLEAISTFVLHLPPRLARFLTGSLGIAAAYYLGASSHSSRSVNSVEHAEEAAAPACGVDPSSGVGGAETTVDPEEHEGETEASEVRMH